MPAKTREESFRENLNTKFRVRAEAPRPVELELVEVKSYEPGESERRGMERFSLFFRGPADIYVPQGTYTLEHERMSALDIFIVPVARDEQGIRYESVFNFFKSDE
jgi:D-alanyl-D-alanine dipeptidase